MNVLMTVAVLGAMAIGEWGEGAATVVLFSLAQLLEARSLERARRAICGLMQPRPGDGGGACAAAWRRGWRAAEVARGETIVVAPGARFPLDGIVESGAQRGGPVAADGGVAAGAAGPGDSVFAGSINGAGALTVRVTRRAGETTLARILRRVEEAQASRAPTQGFVERFARVYTPAWSRWPLLRRGGAAAPRPAPSPEWTYRALVLLVVACPCALVISTPVSIVSALTAASRRGVLVKGGAHLEEIGRVREVVFDKTGTLTRGRPRVTDVLRARAGAARTRSWRWPAAVEARAAHPSGEAVVAHARARRAWRCARRRT